MKIIIMIMGFIVSLTCLSQNKQTSKKQDDNISFEKFINKFTNMPLPLDIHRPIDLEKYGDKIIKEINGKTAQVPNPLCPPISIYDYKFFKDKYPTNRNFYYQSVYRKIYKTYVLLVIIQTNHLTGDYFLKLNIHNLSGNILDTLSIAGQKIDDYDCYCVIDSNFKIRIRTLKYLPENQKGGEKSYESELNLETIEEFIINNDGRFIRTYFKQEKGTFTQKNNEIIQIDKK